MQRPKTIGIIGSTSMVGYYAREYFETHGTRVVMIGRDGKADFQWDVTQPYDHLLGVPKLDALFNAAAFFQGDDADQMRAVNTQGAINAYNLCAALGCPHFIQISSVSASDEQIALTPNDLYGRSKREADDALLHMAEQSRQPLLTILRPSQLIDREGMAEKHQPSFYNIVRLAQRGEPITIFGNEDRVRNYLSVDDLVEAMASAVAHKLTGIQNAVNPEQHSFTKLVETASQHFGKPQTPRFAPDKPSPMPCAYPAPDAFLAADGSVLKPKRLIDIIRGMERTLT